jgi:tetratricopeptide (TPR) repeat protein
MPEGNKTMITDQYNLVALSGVNARSASLYEEALRNFNCYTGDPIALLDQALEESPALVMAHIFKAYAMLTGTDPIGVEAAGAAYHDALKLPANSAEKAHLAAVERLIGGEFAAGARILEDIAIENPRDILALQAGHLFDFLMGRSRMLRDRIARALPYWSEDMPGYHAIIGMHAFGLEETGDYAAAESAGRHAIELNPRDTWAQHAVAHVLQMQGRPQDGLKWMLQCPDNWAKDSFFAVHNWWHTALYHLELGETGQALELFDGPIFGSPTDIAFDLIDASAMLWRLDLRGVDLGERWNSVANQWALIAGDSNYAFNDFHAVLAFARAGRDDEVEKVLEAQRRALTSRSDNQAMTLEVGRPLVSAVLAFRDGDYAEAVDTLRDVRHVAHHFGGSHAQRDLIDLTLIEAAIRDGQGHLAGALVNERLALNPHSASARELQRRIHSAA